MGYLSTSASLRSCEARVLVRWARCGLHHEIPCQADESAVATLAKTKGLKKRSWGVCQERIVSTVLESRLSPVRAALLSPNPNPNLRVSPNLRANPTLDLGLALRLTLTLTLTLAHTRNPEHIDVHRPTGGQWAHAAEAQMMLDTAISTAVYAVVSREETPSSTAGQSFVSLFRGVAPGFNRRLIQQLRAVTPHDCMRAITTHFLPLFDPAASTCAPLSAPFLRPELALGSWGRVRVSEG